MGMFGRGAQYGTPNSFGDVLSILGAGLKDASPESDGGNLLRVQSMLGGRAQEAQRQQLNQQAAGLFGGSGGGLIGGQAAAALDPRAIAARLAELQAQGLDTSAYAKLAELGGPKIQNNGQFTFDGNDPTSANRFFPTYDKGQGPAAFDANHNPIGVQNLPGAVDAAAAMAGATTGAQEQAKAPFVYPNARNQSAGTSEGSAPYDFINVPGPGGQPITLAKSLAKGAAFAGQTPADTVYSTDNAKSAASQYQGLQAAGQKAPVLIAKYQRLGELLAGVEGGKLSPLGLESASLANSIGFRVDPKLPNKEAAAAITNELALALRDPSNGGGMPGAMSDADRNFLIKSVPNLAQSSQGRAMMVQAQVKVLQRQQDVAAKARQWQQRFGRLDAADGTGKTFQDYLDGYATAHPLFKQ